MTPRIRFNKPCADLLPLDSRFVLKVLKGLLVRLDCFVNARMVGTFKNLYFIFYPLIAWLTINLTPMSYMRRFGGVEICERFLYRTWTIYPTDRSLGTPKSVWHWHDGSGTALSTTLKIWRNDRETCNPHVLADTLTTTPVGETRRRRREHKQTRLEKTISSPTLTA